ncbi:hypothetical protein ABEF95_012812 [Exophiala dermatitidis]
MDSNESASPLGANAVQGTKPLGATQNRVRRRNRMITSCLECRRRKLKCDKLHPCTNCSRASRDCLFLAPALDSVSQQRLNEIKEKMGSLEKVLEQDIARKEGRPAPSNSQRRASADLPGGETSSSDNEAAVPEDEKGLEPTPLAVVDASYEDSTNDDVLDLGVTIGRMRLNERLGGFFRPRIHEELNQQLEDPATESAGVHHNAATAPELVDETEDFLSPGPTYIAPGSGFLFGDVGNKRSLINFLPTKTAADQLVRNYYDNVHFLARVVHWPSFQLQYDNFWTSVLAGIEPPPWQQSIVLSILFAAVASMAEEEVTAIFAQPKSVILGSFQTGTEVALSKAQFLRATKLETLQALVVYLIPMCRDQVSRAHSVLVGMAVRLAECMGLHRDPEEVYGLSPIECHVRRIVWFELCWLDFRTCEGQGPRPGIKREDYDTRFPLNIDDADLLSTNPTEAHTRWTDMTMSRIRFECVEMQRIIWFDRIRMEKKKASLTHVLGKIESFRRTMEAKYAPIIDVGVPLQKYAQSVMNLFIQRLFVMVLHRYLHNPSNRVPERLRQLTVQSAVLATENAMALEQIPELKKWRWFSGAYQQWHMAFLLLSLIYQDPNLPHAERVWNIIDFVFEPDLSLPRPMKARSIISTIRDRTAVYLDVRRMRVPVSMKVKVEVPNRVADDSSSRSNSAPLARTPDFVPPTKTSSLIKKESVDQGWSFDTPATLYFSDYGPQALINAKQTLSLQQNQQQPPQSQLQAQAPQPMPGQQLGQRQQQSQASPSQQFDFNSPSDSGTNESWPPLISADQTSWRTVLDSGSASAVPPPPLQAPQGLKASQAVPSDGNPYSFGSGFPNDQVNIPQVPLTLPRGDSVMLDIDWAEWDKLFPPESDARVYEAPPGFPTSAPLGG